MGRGLSEQQRRILAVAYDCYLHREERSAGRRAQLAAAEAAGGLPPAQPPPSRPLRPALHLTHSDALLALYGWRTGESHRSWIERRLHIPSGTMDVYAGWGARRSGTDRVATIPRAEFNVAHASVARTIARLVARGLIAKGGRDTYALTPAGIAFCEGTATASEARQGVGDGAPSGAAGAGPGR
jgi:hypothetical protein